MPYIISIIIATLVGFVLHHDFGREKVYVSQYPEWIYIQDHSIPDDVNKYICTDGKYVTSRSYREYNKNGN